MTWQLERVANRARGRRHNQAHTMPFSAIHLMERGEVRVSTAIGMAARRRPFTVTTARVVSRQEITMADSSVLGRLMRTVDASAQHDLEQAIRSQASVLVTAREPADRASFARLIHEAGARHQGAFVVVRPAPTYEANLGAAGHSEPESMDVRYLAESFHDAEGGSLFIDDINRLSRHGQEWLFACLGEPGMRRRAHRRRPVAPGVRVIAGVGHSLLQDVETGAFNASLFYRLNLIHIDRMPP
jgi:DNA-binding NtrC family response regulator